MQVCLSSSSGQEGVAHITVRECFESYITTKIVKRLESYKVRGGFKDPPKILLLPLSFGVSSIIMLHMLDQQFRIQLERINRTGYEIKVLFIDQCAVIGQTEYEAHLSLLKQRYPSHIYSVVSLENVFDYNINLEDELSNKATFGDNSPSSTNLERMDCLLSSLPSATSRTDIINILRLRLIVAFAQQHGCDNIIWGDSTTRLAERTLSETAKGRGSSIPWLTADGISPYGIKFSYPMRDLLKKELIAYASMVLPPLSPLIMARKPPTYVSASSKDTTIDDLMNQYFESVEQNYPSIVANVVRTSNRLEQPSFEPTACPCQICGLPTTKWSQGLHGWGGDQENPSTALSADAATVERDDRLCYGCARTIINSDDHT